MDRSLFTFSFADILSYIFPGTIMIFAIYSGTSLIMCWKGSMANLGEFSWIEGLVAIPVAYLLGMLSSNAFHLFGMDRGKFVRDSNLDNPLNSIMLNDFRESLKRSYESVFGKNEDWNRQNYYAIRAIVREYASKSAEYADRQVSLRQMRKNCVLPVLLWGVVGLVWGVRLFYDHDFKVGVFISIATVFLTVLIAYALLKGMSLNREFEIRDYCLAFLHLSILGKIGVGKSDAEQQHDQKT